MSSTSRSSSPSVRTGSIALSAGQDASQAVAIAPPLETGVPPGSRAGMAPTPKQALLKAGRCGSGDPIQFHTPDLTARSARSTALAVARGKLVIDDQKEKRRTVFGGLELAFDKSEGTDDAQRFRGRGPERPLGGDRERRRLCLGSRGGRPPRSWPPTTRSSAAVMLKAGPPRHHGPDADGPFGALLRAIVSSSWPARRPRHPRPRPRPRRR